MFILRRNYSYCLAKLYFLVIASKLFNTFLRSKPILAKKVQIVPFFYIINTKEWTQKGGKTKK